MQVQITATIPEWIYQKAGLNKTKNKSARVAELLSKGVDAEEENNLIETFCPSVGSNKIERLKRIQQLAEEDPT